MVPQIIMKSKEFLMPPKNKQIKILKIYHVLLEAEILTQLRWKERR